MAVNEMFRDKSVFDWTRMYNEYNNLPEVLDKKGLQEFVLSHLFPYYFYVMSDENYKDTPWGEKSFDPLFSNIVKFTFWSNAQMDNKFLNKKLSCYHLDSEGVKQYKSVRIWSLYKSHPKRREYQRVVCDPNPATLHPNSFNTYVGLRYDREEVVGLYQSNVSLVGHFLEYVCNLVPDLQQREYLLDWMAFCIQKPWALIHTYIVLVGPQGSGKSLLWRILIWLMSIYAKSIQNFKNILDWTDAIQRLFFIFIDEAKLDEKALEQLGTWVTEPIRQDKQKYVKDSYSINMVKWGLAADKLSFSFIQRHNRRLALIECKKIKNASATGVFERIANLYLTDSAESKALMGYFYSRDLTKFGVGNDKPISTTQKRLVLSNGEDGVLHWWRRCLYEGFHVHPDKLADKDSKGISWSFTDGRELDSNGNYKTNWVREVMHVQFYDAYSDYMKAIKAPSLNKVQFYTHIHFYAEITSKIQQSGKSSSIGHRIPNGKKNGSMKNYIYLPDLEGCRQYFDSHTDCKWNDPVSIEGMNTEIDFYTLKKAEYVQEEVIPVPFLFDFDQICNYEVPEVPVAVPIPEEQVIQLEESPKLPELPELPELPKSPEKRSNPYEEEEDRKKQKTIVLEEGTINELTERDKEILRQLNLRVTEVVELEEEKEKGLEIPKERIDKEEEKEEDYY
jgi:hypothetical protein